MSGSVQLDGTAPQPLLSASEHGLRHYRVPQHLAWPDALGHAALCVYVTPDMLKASGGAGRESAHHVVDWPRSMLGGVKIGA